MSQHGGQGDLRIAPFFNVDAGAGARAAVAAVGGDNEVGFYATIGGKDRRNARCAQLVINNIRIDKTNMLMRFDKIDEHADEIVVGNINAQGV